jgi:hypothetical protein
MDLNKKLLEREVSACKAAIKAHEEGTAVNKIVLEAFEIELKKF